MMLIITSSFPTARIEPNKKLFISLLTPLTIEIANVPIARDDDDIRAIIESLCIILLSFNLIIRKDTKATVIRENGNGVIDKTVAKEKLAKATWDNPSPIIEFLLNTRLVPIKEEVSDISTPTIKALIINVYENISVILFIIMYPPYKRICISKKEIFSKR